MYNTCRDRQADRYHTGRVVVVIIGMLDGRQILAHTSSFGILLVSAEGLLGLKVHSCCLKLRTMMTHARARTHIHLSAIYNIVISNGMHA